MSVNMMGLFSVSLIVFLPFIAGVFLLARSNVSSWLLPLIYLSTTLLSLVMLFRGETLLVSLTGSFGVRLLLDRFAWTFVFMNGLVSLGIFFSPCCKKLSNFASPIMMMLHGTANAIFISYDLFNLFVCIELVSILAFLLIRIGDRPRQIWSAVQYLIISNVGMILYLLGCLFAYNWSGSFSLEAVKTLPKLPLYLLITGLSVKGGVFMTGLWLPEAHGEAESAVSALLSGIIVKCGIAPLLRIAQISSTGYYVISLLAVFSALSGVIYAVLEKDIKKMLAYHTISQAGFMLVFPPLGHIYALAHGLFKAWLFLSASNLETRDLGEVKKKGIKIQVWFPLFLGALAISGFPGLGGYGIKTAIITGVKDWQIPLMYLAAIGTSLSFAKLVFIPIIPGGRIKQFFNMRNCIFLVSLVFLDMNGGYFSPSYLLKSFLIIIFGWAIYLLLLKNRLITLPKEPENLDNIIGITFLIILAMIGVYGL